MLKNRTTNAVPSFLLRGIDPLAVLEKYKSGGYNSFSFSIDDSSGGDYSVETAPLVVVPLRQRTKNDQVVVIRDKNKYNRTFVFSNVREYERFESGDSPAADRFCDNCMLSEKEFKDEPASIPLMRETRIVKSRSGEMIELPIIWGEGFFCDLRCCFSALKRETSLNFKMRDIMLSNSEMMLRELFRQKYPKKILKEAPDRRLLKTFGGSLSHEEWKGTEPGEPGLGSSEYRRTVNTLIVPAKITYERMR